MNGPVTNRPANDRTHITSRLFSGMIVLTVGVLWMLDNLGMISASRVIGWWGIVALAWGVMCLTGLGRRRNPIAGGIWSIVGIVGIIDQIGIVSASIFDLWPLAIIALGIVLVIRGSKRADEQATPGGDVAGPRLHASAFVATARHRVVSAEFRGGDVTAVLGAAIVDLREAELAGGRAELDVFVALGGMDLIVPPGWRVSSEITPILGAYQDSTVTGSDPVAPLLVLKGSAVMGGVEVLNEPREKKFRTYGNVVTDESGRERVVVGPGGVVFGAVIGRDRHGRKRVKVTGRAEVRGEEARGNRLGDSNVDPDAE